MVGLPALFRGDHVDVGNLELEEESEAAVGDHLVSQSEMI